MISFIRIIFWLIAVLTISAKCYGVEKDNIAPVERLYFTYYFDNPAYIDQADSILNEVRLELADLLGDTLVYKPSVYLLNDVHQFKKIVHGVFPDWGAAAAFPAGKLIAVKSPDHFHYNKSLAELLRHEFAHLALAARTGIRKVPRWFDEGMAMVVSSEWGWTNNLAMSKAALFGEFIPLKEIENLNRFDEGKASVAYAQSYLAVNYLYEEYDQETITIFLDEIARGSLIDDALMASIGSDYAGFEKEYQFYLKRRYNLVTIFTDTMYFWLALAIIVIIGAFLQYRRRRKYYKKWQEEEKFQSTDFDYGDPDKPEQIDDEDKPWQN